MSSVETIIVPYNAENEFHRYTKSVLDKMLETDVPFHFERIQEVEVTVRIITGATLVIDDPRLNFIFELKGGRQLWEQMRNQYAGAFYCPYIPLISTKVEANATVTFMTRYNTV